MDRADVTGAVLVVGPGAVLGPHPVPEGLDAAACAAIDDSHTLVDDRPVAVAELWRTVLRAAGGTAERLELIYPGWWGPTRLDRIVAAGAGTEIAARQRHEAHAEPCDAIVEIAPDFVLVRIEGRPVAATPRLGDTAAVSGAVDEHLTVSGPVLIDAPIGVAGAAALAAAIARRSRARGRDTTVVDDHVLAREATPTGGSSEQPAYRRVPVPAAVAGALLTAAALLALPERVDAAHSSSTSTVTEGRVAVQFPAGWTVARITTGSGSPRLQSISPQHRDAAILLTQSPSGPDSTATADVLATALRQQPPGVFTDFRADGHRAGRAVVTYSEIRDARIIDWAVFVDGPVRIAIGCQQPATNTAIIRAHCDEAVRSARHAMS